MRLTHFPVDFLASLRRPILPLSVLHAHSGILDGSQSLLHPYCALYRPKDEHYTSKNA